VVPVFYPFFPYDLFIGSAWTIGLSNRSHVSNWSCELLPSGFDSLLTKFIFSPETLPSYTVSDLTE
jgi:hypothetical protein